jgi:hypothetical protein
MILVKTNHLFLKVERHTISLSPSIQWSSSSSSSWWTVMWLGNKREVHEARYLLENWWWPVYRKPQKQENPSVFGVKFNFQICWITSPPCSLTHLAYTSSYHEVCKARCNSSSLSMSRFHGPYFLCQLFPLLTSSPIVSSSFSRSYNAHDDKNHEHLVEHFHTTSHCLHVLLSIA